VICIESSKVSLFEKIYDVMRSFSIWINVDQLDLWITL